MTSADLRSCINCGLTVENGAQLLCLRCMSVPPRISAVERLALRRLTDAEVRARYADELVGGLAGEVGNVHAVHALWFHWELVLRRQDPRAA